MLAFPRDAQLKRETGDTAKCSSAPVLQYSSGAAQEGSTRSVSTFCPSVDCDQCDWDGSGRGLLKDNVLFASVGLGFQSFNVLPLFRNSSLLNTPTEVRRVCVLTAT